MHWGITMIPFKKLEKVVEKKRYEKACERFAKLNKEEQLAALFNPLGDLFGDEIPEFEDIPF